MSLQGLTQLSTACIVASGASLLLGWYFIRTGRQVERHRAAMLAATAFAALFLVFYVTCAALNWAVYARKGSLLSNAKSASTLNPAE